MTRSIKLSDLGLRAKGGADPVVSHITADSRDIADGTLFAALPGSQAHGARFLAGIPSEKLSAIITDAEGAEIAGHVIPDGIAVIVAEDPRQTLAQTASLFYGAHPATVVAVTGTNGKTSVSTFTRQIWEALGKAAVNFGTTGVEGSWAHPLSHTTPDPVTLHKVMAKAATEGVTHVAMEASSHGLDQRRLDGVLLTAAGFTNFTQDHLDYHETFAAYFEAKAGLFSRVLTDEGVAVINFDDPKSPALADICTARGQEVIGVGRHADARLKITAQRFDATGQTLRFEWQGRPFQTYLNLIGGFQADNVMLAAGLVIAAGAMPGDVFDILPSLTTVRGRMELAARCANGASVFVDYAHTPDAVETALAAMRPHVMGQLIAIVGAGGDRDVTKRPLMGAAAVTHADTVIVTDDNPRSEDPAGIRAAVMAGARGAHSGKTVTEIGDRAEAILRGIDMLGQGDALLIAGKGHETGQIIGDAILPFDDVEQASVAVAALEGRI